MDASAALAAPYDVRGPQGGFDRFLVYVRVNADLAQRPSTDTKLASVVWSADGPYGAMAAATAWATAQGLQLRHIFGIVEWPRTAEEVTE
jgi:hypothetical protein